MVNDQLSLAKKFSYGVGHVLNDLTASMWFSYLLLYLHRVVLFDNSLAGYMMLLGQIADALSTIFIGFESDRTEHGLCNYGRRKSWHLVGVISILISFPFMFNLCITCENTEQWALFYYYAPFVVIFQFGWAATQISHLSLIPQLTSSKNERVALNAIRYAFTVMSNLFVYGITYLLLLLKKENSDQDDDSKISRYDSPKFMYLTIIVVLVGLFFQIIFHLGTNENSLKSDDEIQEQSDSNELRLNWLGYLKNGRFYVMGLLYMATRLIVNMTQVYLPMYVSDSAQLDKSSIALIPFICYISGFVSTFPLRALSKYCGTYLTYFFGIILIAGCSGLFWYKTLIFSSLINTIVGSILLGSGSTVILVTSLSLTSDLVGSNTGSSAFVFGSMSFLDKLSNGIAVALLQQFSPCPFHSVTCDCRSYYHRIMAFLPLTCSVFAFAVLIILFIIRPRNNEATLLVNVDENTNDYGSIRENNNNQ